MSSVQDHYENLLAEHYSWMFGLSFEEKVDEQAKILKAAGVEEPQIALDLGCGSGFQSFALAKLGAKKIVAFDTSQTLLDELASHRTTEPIRCSRGDLTDFVRDLEDSPDTIVCMGDTLTHLPDRASVSKLFDDVASELKPGGRFILSYRDLSNPPSGLDRFIPLRSTTDKIMTCFLEPVGDRVVVHDLIHVLDGEEWVLHKSAFAKLVLPENEIRVELEAAGLGLGFGTNERGLTILEATKGRA